MVLFRRTKDVWTSERDELRYLMVVDPTHHSKTALDLAMETVRVGREHKR